MLMLSPLSPQHSRRMKLPQSHQMEKQTWRPPSLFFFWRACKSASLQRVRPSPRTRRRGVGEQRGRKGGGRKGGVRQRASHRVPRKRRERARKSEFYNGSLGASTFFPLSLSPSLELTSSLLLRIAPHDAPGVGLCSLRRRHRLHAPGFGRGESFSAELHGEREREKERKKKMQPIFFLFKNPEPLLLVLLLSSSFKNSGHRRPGAPRSPDRLRARRRERPCRRQGEQPYQREERRESIFFLLSRCLSLSFSSSLSLTASKLKKLKTKN